MIQNGLRVLARGIVMPLAAVLLLSACLTTTLVSPYDELIDKGVAQYNENLVAFAGDMVAKFGTPAGTYEQNQDFYIKQTGKLETFILRAEAQDPGRGCLMAGRAVELLGDRIPASIKPKSNQRDGSTSGCMVELLKNIKQQLGLLETVHKVKKTIKTSNGTFKEITGLKNEEAKSFLNGSSRSIRAVMAVELMKKQGILNDGN